MTDSKKNNTSVKSNALTTKDKVVDAGTKEIPKKTLTKKKTKIQSGTKSKKANDTTKPKATSKLDSLVKPKSSLNDVPDLNKNKGYPVHPDRIWPD